MVQAEMVNEPGRNIDARSMDFRAERHVQPRNIPSLDGLRAICILSVLFAHSAWLLPARISASSPFRYIVGNGMHGVAVFFVISGYLITTLLLRELDTYSEVSLRRFYFRRSLRIFPPFLRLAGVHGLALGNRPHQLGLEQPDCGGFLHLGARPPRIGADPVAYLVVEHRGTVLSDLAGRPGAPGWAREGSSLDHGNRLPVFQF